MTTLPPLGRTEIAPPEWSIALPLGRVVHEVLDGEKVKVRLTHLGWGEGESWNRLYDYFDKAWGGFLSALEARFASG